MIKLKKGLWRILISVFLLLPFLLLSEGFEKISIAGTPHIIYGNMISSDGSIPPEDVLTFKAYVTTREDEILIKSEPGCGYKDGWWWIEIGNFVTDWAIDDTLHIDFTNTSSGEENIVDITLNGSGNQQVSLIRLNEDWNLISLCIQPANTDITEVLGPISGKYISVWAYVGGDIPWKYYDPNTQTGDLTTLEAGVGYWLNMSESAILTISGSKPSSEISLNSGWNLVGFNSLKVKSVSDALTSIGGKFLFVWAFVDGTWKVYDPILPGFSDLTSMEPNYGYWIYVTEDCAWTIGGSP